MQGLGAIVADFADVAAVMCGLAAPRSWRFVLPHAPRLPVTINAGMVMPAWYDILQLDHPRAVDWGTVAESAAAVEALLAEEPAERVVLAGFSQGAAMALHLGLRHQDKASGVLMMSGYLLESDDHPCPAQCHDLPIALFHGTDDPMVPFLAAEQSLSSLRNAGYAPTLTPYEGLEHGVNEAELSDVFEWLCKR